MDRYILTSAEDDSGRLIPILVAHRVKSSEELHKLMLRLTPQERYKKEDVEIWLDTLTDSWVLGREDSKKGKEHYHISIYSTLDEDVMRSHVNSFLMKWFPEAPKRGDANKRYNLTTADNIEKAIQYSIKDKDMSYGKGINPKFIEKAIKKSYQKYDKVTLAQEIEKLKEDFKVNNEMSIADFMIGFVNIKAKYRQPINMNYVHQLALTCECNRKPEYSERLVNDYLIKISKWS